MLLNSRQLHTDLFEFSRATLCRVIYQGIFNMTLTIIQYFWCYNEPYPPTDYTVNTIWSIIYQSQTLLSPFSGNCVPLNERIMTWCFSRKFSGTKQHLFLSFIDVPSQRAQNLDLLSAYQSVCSVLTWVITHSKHRRLDVFWLIFP